MRLFILILLAVLCADIREAHACSCAMAADSCGAMERMSAIFVGRVVSPSNDLARVGTVRLEVIESFKGLETESKFIDIPTGVGGMCGFSFKANQTYLVYAYESQPGVLTTSICTRTGELSTRQHDVSVLREMKDGKTPTTRLFGKVTKWQLRVDGSLGSDVIPLGKVRVRSESGTFARETTTDATGTFLFTGLPPGNYALRLFLPERFERGGPDRINVVRVKCAVELNLYFARAPLQGTLSRHDGSPVRPWSRTVTAVAISGAQDAPSENRSTSTIVQLDGKWTFDGLPPGRYLIGVHAFKPITQWDPLQQPFWYPNASRPSDAKVVVVTGETQQTLDLRFPPPPEEIYFHGTMVGPDGRPMRGGVWVYDVDLGRRVSNATVDDMGRFRVKAWRGHRYRLRGMNCQSAQRLQSQELSLPDDPSAPLRVVLDTPCPSRP
jgi:hypothetical protein